MRPTSRSSIAPATRASTAKPRSRRSPAARRWAMRARPRPSAAPARAPRTCASPPPVAASRRGNNARRRRAVAGARASPSRPTSTRAQRSPRAAPTAKAAARRPIVARENVPQTRPAPTSASPSPRARRATERPARKRSAASARRATTAAAASAERRPMASRAASPPAAACPSASRAPSMVTVVRTTVATPEKGSNGVNRPRPASPKETAASRARAAVRAARRDCVQWTPCQESTVVTPRRQEDVAPMGAAARCRASAAEGAASSVPRRLPSARRRAFRAGAPARHGATVAMRPPIA
jgi:hypothetical protein